MLTISSLKKVSLQGSGSMMEYLEFVGCPAQNPNLTLHILHLTSQARKFYSSFI